MLLKGDILSAILCRVALLFLDLVVFNMIFCVLRHERRWTVLNMYMRI